MRLGDVCEIDSSLVDPREAPFRDMLHVGGANIESATGRFLDLQTASEEGLISGKFHFHQDSVLYSKIRPYLMKVARPSFEGLCSADIYPLCPLIQVLDRDYLYYLLLSPGFTDFAISGSARAGMPKVNRDHLFDYRFELPSLSEQHRIVALLDEAFAGIGKARDTTERNLENAREVFDSFLEGVFSQKQKGWIRSRLADHLETISTGPFGTMLHKSDYVSDGIPLVNPMNLVDGRIEPSRRMMVSGETRDRLGSYLLSHDDIVIARRGELGRCAVVTKKEVGWLCGTGSLFIHLRGSLEPDYFVAFFRSPTVRKGLDAASVGTTMNNLNQGIMESLEVPIPPIEEQRALLARFKLLRETVNHLTALYHHKLAALDALKQSLLHQAFHGDL